MICDTQLDGSFSVTHEKSGLAVVFTESLEDAQAAAQYLDQIDWTQDREALAADQDIRDIVNQVKYFFGDSPWSNFCLGAEPADATL